MSDRTTRRTYRHALSIIEAVETIFGFERQYHKSDPAAFSTLSDVLLHQMERAEEAHANAIAEGADKKELPRLAEEMAAAKRDYDMALYMTLELKDAADAILQGHGHDILVLSRHEHPTDEPQFTKSSLYAWAKERWGMDVVALQPPEPPESPGATLERDLTEGQKIFYCMAYLFDAMMTQYHGDWRAILADETDETTKDFFLAGRINQSVAAGKIADQLPSPLSGFGQSKTPTNHVKSMETYLLSDSPVRPNELSPQAKPKAQVSLYGLACIVWSKSTGEKLPDPEKCNYPEGYLNEIVAALPADFALPQARLDAVLNTARREVIRQRDKAEAAPTSKK